MDNREKNPKRLFADVVLDPLGIPLGRFLRKPKGTQERDHQAVAPARHLGQLAAGFGQEDRPVRAVLDQAIALQAGYGIGYRRLGDPEVLGNIDGARLAVDVDQIGDQFDIILGGLGAMGRARLAKTFRRPPAESPASWDRCSWAAQPECARRWGTWVPPVTSSLPR